MKLNEQQMQAVNSNAKKIVCIASAGSGKTTVLLQRINRLILEGVSPDSILVLTFTNAAAQELTERFRRDNSELNTIPKFGTFHAFCYSILAKDQNIRFQLGYTDIPNIATEDQRHKAWTIARVSCNIKISDKKLSGKREALTVKEQFEYDVFWKAFKKQLCMDNVITFDILCYDVSQLFVDNIPIIQKYKEQYRYVCIDEFQDTDDRQYLFAESFTNSDIYCCGDPQQMLYRFRGCTNEIIKRLAENPEWELIKLPYNYRSTKQIVEYANKIFLRKWQGSPYYLEGIADKSGEDVHLEDRFPSTTQALVPIATEMQAKINEQKSVAILCRTNSEVSDIQEMFKALNIPTRGKADNTEIIGILRSSIDSDYCVQWIAGMLPNEEYVRYLRLSTLDPSINEEPKFLQNFGTKYVRLLDKIFKCRTILSENILLIEKIRKLAEYLNIKLTLDEIADKSMEDAIEYIINKIDTALSQGIYIGTIHSVKGLEYDVVHVIGVDGIYFKTMKDEDNMACFYVACTRAKEQLYLWFDD